MGEDYKGRKAKTKCDFGSQPDGSTGKVKIKFDFGFLNLEFSLTAAPISGCAAWNESMKATRA